MLSRAGFVALAFLFAAVAQTRATDVGAQIVFDSRTGPVANAVRYAPTPVVPPEAHRLTGYGIYVIDVDAGGQIGDVRVLRSAGHKTLDDAAMQALRKWVFRPRSIYKATIPIRFGFGAGGEPRAEAPTHFRR